MHKYLRAQNLLDHIWLRTTPNAINTSMKNIWEILEIILQKALQS